MCLAVPGKILEVSNRAGASAGQRVAKVEFGGVTHEIYLDFVPEAALGDYVLAHVGFAISVLDCEEAERTFALLQELGEIEET